MIILQHYLLALKENCRNKREPLDWKKAKVGLEQNHGMGVDFEKGANN
jgi:hypothetical protein